MRVLDAILTHKPQLEASIWDYLDARRSNKQSTQITSALARSRRAGKVPANGGTSGGSSRETRLSGKGSRKTFSNEQPVCRSKRAKWVASPVDHEEPESSTPAASPTKPGDNGPDMDEGGREEQEEDGEEPKEEQQGEESGDDLEGRNGGRNEDTLMSGTNESVSDEPHQTAHVQDTGGGRK